MIYSKSHAGFNIQGLEALWISIRTRNKAFMVCVCYRHTRFYSNSGINCRTLLTLSKLAILYLSFCVVI